MVKIKICGLTNIDDYNSAVLLGADYTGFIFYKNSVRCAVAEDIKKCIDNGQKGKNLKVGVFVNEHMEKVREIYRYVGLDIVQLHGEETAEYCKDLNLPYWKTIRVHGKSSLKEMEKFECPAFLLDKFSKKLYGGTGEMIDLDIARLAIKTNRNIIIAGGLSADNVEEVLKLSPYAVDGNSLLEDSPGKKSKPKMELFFKKVREYGK